jgi:CheY-like chemotaxis protein
MPLDEATSAAPLAPTQTTVRRSCPARVLVVEDNHVIALDIEGVLRALGVDEVLLTTRLTDALAALRRGPWDLAILDHHLAEGETTAAVAFELHERFVPILHIGEDEMSAAEDGAVRLAKPFSQGQLERAIDATLALG